MPELVDADGVTLALNAPSRTFDLAANAFADDFYSPIAKTVDGCNNCHEALATTFHSPDRGGNIVVCRMCHITKSGASHLRCSRGRSTPTSTRSIRSRRSISPILTSAIQWQPCTTSITSSSRIPSTAVQTAPPATLRGKRGARPDKVVTWAALGL